ncbi:hypothetical protein NE236_19945 [Actinoallomurus purpureus]|uniref:hypothetical protein n=1 Tax=Actinoallomurus purpureus TaxID=478114 RepID=UPI0020934AD8|nr:hypothetical protein [Actinoallomurus purpureus]MCO6007257.1 hypothetical protein [Actinoallomurus purpureus]
MRRRRRGARRGDPDLLGKLVASRDTAIDERHGRMAHAYLKLLSAHGLLRDDMDIDELGYAYQATFEGFLRAEESGPEDGLDRRAALLAQTVRRAFEVDSVSPDAPLEDVAAATVTLLDELIAADRAESDIPEA